ncbi:MAG: carbon starvation CstA family protein, partial [Candidatus Poribacteria bacterium]|nr:carbon starvation CstA family protein [Candidatus Poribacteria bacterium]
MDTLIVAVLSFVGFIVAYHTYGRWIANKIFGSRDCSQYSTKTFSGLSDYVKCKKGFEPD